MKIEYISTFKRLTDILIPLKKKSKHGGISVIGLDIEFMLKSTINKQRIKRYNIKHKFNNRNQPKWVEKRSRIIPCVLSIACKDLCLVINLTTALIDKKLPRSLCKIIESPSWIKSGNGIYNDIQILSNSYNISNNIRGIIDMEIFAKMNNVKNRTLGRMYKLVSKNCKLYDKQESIGKWDTDLSQEHINYAANDAIMSYYLFMRYIEPSNIFIKNKLLNKHLAKKCDCNYEIYNQLIDGNLCICKMIEDETNIEMECICENIKFSCICNYDFSCII